MRGLVLVAGLVLSVAAAVAAHSGGGGRSPDLAPPVDLTGFRIQIESISATVKVVGAPNPSPGASRSITVNGKMTPIPLAGGLAPKPNPEGEFAGTSAVLWAEVTKLVGDDREFELQDVRRRHTSNASQRRQQLSQALLRNPHQLLQPPPHLSAEQLMAMRMIPNNFSAHAQLDALPAHIDRMVVEMDVVHASEMDVASVPLEAMEEHKEIVPGVRFLVREVEQVESSGRQYTRVAMEYFIDRVHPEENEDDPNAFEATPLIPAIAIRDANGQVLHLIQRAHETVTRDSFILSISDINMSVSAQAVKPLRVDIVVLHGMEQHEVEMVVEDVALAGE